MARDAGELRRLLNQARLLRLSALETGDAFYRELFLRTASALERHARELAFGAPPNPARIDILC